MAEFKLESAVGDDYKERMTIEVRFQAVPNQEDYTAIVGAMETLTKLGEKYITLQEPPVVMEGESD